MILGLAGFARSGKDTVAEYLVKEYKFKKYALADTIRDAAIALDPYVLIDISQSMYGGQEAIRLAELVGKIGWEQAKENEDVRRLLQRFGTEVGRNMFGETFWVNRLLKKIVDDEAEKVVVSDIRFDNEVFMCDRVWKVTRPNVEKLNNHPSENGISYYHELIVNDSSIGELYRAVDEALYKLAGMQKARREAS